MNTIKYSLEVYNNNNLIFNSNSKWLHPIFEFEEFLKTSNYNPANLIVKDKIIGRAAALLFIYIDIKKIHADILSKRGKEILDQFQIEYKNNTLVERIQCQTEELLKDESEPDLAYHFLRKRAGLT